LCHAITAARGGGGQVFATRGSGGDRCGVVAEQVRPARFACARCAGQAHYQRSFLACAQAVQRSLQFV